MLERGGVRGGVRVMALACARAAGEWCAQTMMQEGQGCVPHARVEKVRRQEPQAQPADIQNLGFMDKKLVSRDH